MRKCKKCFVLLFVLFLFCTACGKEVSEEDVSISVIRHGKEYSRNADTELLEVLEAVVTEECKAPRMLNLMMTLSEVENYKEDGTYIEVVYKNGKAFPVMENSSETVIDKVFFLIGEAPLNCYVCYDTEAAYCTFFLSDNACDKISKYLN